MKGVILKVGDKFNRLTILRLESTDATGHIRWACRCDCGNEHTVRSDKLTSGRIKSCGCLQAEINAAHQEAKRSRYLLREEIISERNRLKHERKLKHLSENLTAVKDYRNLDYTGSPKLAADWFLAWSIIVSKILRAGPSSDSISIQVRITVNDEEKKKQDALKLLDSETFRYPSDVLNYVKQNK